MSQFAPASVAAIVLAAGTSHRMGRRNKLLLPFRGRPLVAHVVAAAQEATGGAVLVVTGHQAERVEAALEDYDARFVRNADFRGGMAASLRCGVAATPPEASGYLICLGDMPHLSAEALRVLCERFADGPADAIVTFAGVPGPPIVFGRRHRGALLHVEGDTGAQALLRAHADAVVRLSPGAAGLSEKALGEDIDTPDAYERLTRSAPPPDR